MSVAYGYRNAASICAGFSMQLRVRTLSCFLFPSPACVGQ